MLPLLKQVLENFRFDVDPKKSREQNTEEVIKSAALLAGAIAVEPIPFADILLITPVQAKMVLHIGKIHGFDITPERARDIVQELGATVVYGMVARQVMRGVIKTIAPVIGGVVTAPLVYGWTFALGRVAERYFQARISGLPFEKVEQKQVARGALKTVEKPTVDALGELAKELRSRATEKKDDGQIN
ncbi:YcjF family protein [Deinococcus pimensis]|uniref:YcjF family protein n=1 Tax=Deinococcus pimensis TaxID=309888 RepID=UPI0004894E08|nr:DUF697 domain-containing protein [Deinococcus pimensis]